MSKFMSVVGIFVVMTGTILSLWSIITTKTSFVGTCADWDSKSEQFKKEKILVVVGCILIVFGSILQIIAIFV